MAVARQTVAWAGWRSGWWTLILCLVLDAMVAGIYLSFLVDGAPGVGWGLLLVVPVVLAAAHQSLMVRCMQVISTVAVMSLILATAPGSAVSAALDGAMVGGSLVASAWVTYRLFRQVYDHLTDLHIAANTDRLTGVLNRRGLHASYPEFAAAAEALGKLISVITVDLDSMKRINDTYGHQVGDRVLQQLTDRLSQAASGALIARIGGDECVVVLAGSPESVLHRLQLLLQTDPIQPNATVSIGTAIGSAVPELEALWNLVALADQKLYTAKRQTRGDRTRLATRSATTPIDSRLSELVMTPPAATSSLLPTREQRELYAAVIIWDALVGTTSTLIGGLDGSSGRGINLWVLAISVSIAAILVWRLLRQGAAQSFFTGVLVSCAAVLTLISLTKQHGPSGVGEVLWAPLLLLAARYWPRSRMIGIYAWFAIVATVSHIVKTGIGTEPSAKVVLQVVAMIVAAELLYQLRRRDENLVEQLTLHALTDPLTGLANRRGLEAAAQQLLPGAVSALILDIDGFKQVNDEYGHHEGDQTLISVASALTCLTPTGAVAARLGGDEFLLLGSALDPNELMKLLSEAALSLSTPVSLSFGTARTMVVSDIASLWQLINVADQHLLAGRMNDGVNR